MLLLADIGLVNFCRSRLHKRKGTAGDNRQPDATAQQGAAAESGFERDFAVAHIARQRTDAVPHAIDGFEGRGMT
jgi:hypothetical protein